MAAFTLEEGSLGNDTDILADLQDEIETTEAIAIMAISEKSQPPDFNAGDITWVLASTFLVFLMTPGLGFFYSGMAKSKSALHILMLCFVSMVIVSIQWFCFGYSLAFSNTSSTSSLSSVIGNFDNAFMMNMATEPSILNDKIPALVFYIFQNMFAAITPALAIGAAAERGRFLPCIVFMLIWTTFVYDVLAYWSWNPNGWVAKMGALDFAGGTPIHIASGAAALAYAVILGPRKEVERESAPHNMANVVLGTALIWFGWFGFNGGSALAANGRAIMACIVTNLAACVGGVTWITIDYFFEHRKYSPMGFCAGVIAGLVSVTPASGFISPPSSVAFGFFGAICCRLALYSKRYWKLDDALDVFAVHGVGGIVGNLLTGIFAQKWVAALDGAEIDGGWLDGNWVQIVYQAADTVAGMAWSYAVTWIILYVMNKIPGLSLRVKAEKETAGLDSAELGITAYEHILEAIKQGIHLTRSARKISSPMSPANEVNGNDATVVPMNNA